MFDLRKRIFIGAGVVVGIFLSIFLFYSFINNRSIKVENVVQVPNTTTPPTGSDATLYFESIGKRVVEPTPEALEAGEPDKLYLEQLARIFVERFGSFSNENSNSHIDDALALSTPNMKSWIEAQRVDQTGEYSAKTTQVVVSNLLDSNDEEATVELEVQERLENTLEEELVYRSAKVELVNISGEWKISGLYWQ